MDSEYSLWAEKYAYEIYTSDMLMAIGRCVGMKVEKRLFDIVSNMGKIEDERSGDEIAHDVIERLGLEVTI